MPATPAVSLPAVDAMNPRRTLAALVAAAGIAAPLGICAAGGERWGTLEPLHAAQPAVGTSAGVGVVPVSFVFATREEGHELRLTDVHLVILCPVVGRVFEAVSEGPFLIANVPAGRYEVIASHEGQARRIPLTVTRGESRQVSIYW